MSTVFPSEIQTFPTMQDMSASDAALVKQYQELIRLDGSQLTFTDGALRAMAQLAIKRNTGARGLRSIIEDVMRDVMFDLPSRKDVEKVIIDKRCVTQHTEPRYVLKDEKAS